MIKRTLYFGNPAYLKKQNNQMLVQLKDKPETVISIEDIGMVVLDHPQVTLTHGLSNALINNNAAVLWCNDRHLPNGLILPYECQPCVYRKVALSIKQLRAATQKLVETDRCCQD
jgi:CRISPR-associated protein Cas1